MSAVGLVRRSMPLFPLFVLTLAFRSEEMPGPIGLKNSAFSLLLIVAWTGLTKDLRCLVQGATATDVQQHLERGKQFLAAGQLADALSQYHSAVEGDPTNYLTYFRRATVYLAMGKSKSALPDLDRVLELKPDFNSARLQRANVKLRQGKLDEARVDYEEIIRRDPTSTEAMEHMQNIGPLQESIANARLLFDNNDVMGAVHMLEQPVELCPWDADLRELRAECYIRLNDYQKAISDLRPATKLRSDNTAAFLKLSRLLYEHGNSDDSLIEIRECLKLDQDHHSCQEHYRKVKKLVQAEQSVMKMKEESRWDDCIAKVAQMSKVENKVDAYVLREWGYLCTCHSKAGHLEDAMQHCTQLLEHEPDNAMALCDRADAHLLNEKYEEAIEDFKKAETIETGDDGLKKRAQEGTQRAQKLFKQSQKRDYYKILGIKRTAQKPEILKAYRKLAAQWHPDQYKGEDKEKAEKMFIDIAAAKEVLTDPEKREKFDQGEDPLDPEQQAGGQQWQQGFNPFGAGGFQFKFHFN
jgi:DnaJ family protein C protein 3